MPGVPSCFSIRVLRQGFQLSGENVVSAVSEGQSPLVLYICPMVTVTHTIPALKCWGF